MTRLIVPLIAFLFGSFILIGAQLFVRPRLASFQDLPDQTEQRFLAKLKTGEFCGARGPQFAELLQANRTVLNSSIKLNFTSLQLISLLSAVVAIFGACWTYSLLRSVRARDYDGPV